MCGIVGYIGQQRSQPILLKGLEKLEYRGYDSCGIAVLNSRLRVYKDAVRIGVLGKALPMIDGEIGIGHTRWATHGEPSQKNSHPHLDCTKKIAVVHNGIITNYQALRRQLTSEGHVFTSETDSEVIPHLIEKYYKGNLEEAVEAVLHIITGSYAILVIREGEDKLIAARKDSPLIIGFGDREYFAASDVPALLDYTNKVVYMDDGEMAVMKADGIRITKDGNEIKKDVQKILWSASDAQKTGYEHFMLKEISEQPRVIRDTFTEYLSNLQSSPGHEQLSDSKDGLLILASGTSYHAGLIGKNVFESITDIPVRTEASCEFCYQVSPVKMGAIGISQSGETADTIQAMKRIKEARKHLTVITNTVGSSASRLADEVFYTRAGQEVSVAATKTFIAQLVTLYCLALSNSRISSSAKDRFVSNLKNVPNMIERLISDGAVIKECADYLSDKKNAFYIARGINLPVALEGALKLKEISYIHAEGYSAGELKHGPFALLGEETPVIAIVGRDNTYEPMLSNIKEVKSRKSMVIAITEEGDVRTEELADVTISLPQIDPLFSPFLASVVIQLIAYHTARLRGCPIDFPRNLAKSVTVE